MDDSSVLARRTGDAPDHALGLQDQEITSLSEGHVTRRGAAAERVSGRGALSIPHARLGASAVPKDPNGAWRGLAQPILVAGDEPPPLERANHLMNGWGGDHEDLLDIGLGR